MAWHVRIPCTAAALRSLPAEQRATEQHASSGVRDFDPGRPLLQRRQMMGMAAPKVYLPSVVVEPAQRMLEAAAAMSGDTAPPCRLEALDVSCLSWCGATKDADHLPESTTAGVPAALASSPAALRWYIIEGRPCPRRSGLHLKNLPGTADRSW